MRKLAVALAIILLGALAWTALQTGEISIVVNGHRLAWPAWIQGAGAGVRDALIVVVALFCAAILPALLFAGIGLVALAGLVLVALLAASLAFPFLLFLLVPLVVVWIFVALLGRDDRTKV
jgi:hypothetical protein